MALKSKPEECLYDWCYPALSQVSIITFFKNLTMESGNAIYALSNKNKIIIHSLNYKVVLCITSPEFFKKSCKNLENIKLQEKQESWIKALSPKSPVYTQ